MKFVRAEAWGIGGLYASAIDAWRGAVVRHPGDRTPPVGAPMFYEGGQYGHVVVATANQGPGMRGTDMPNSGAVSESDVGWPERAWGVSYLGWTEDLNGVDLPLDTEEDEMTPDDWEKLRAIVADEVARNNREAADAVWFRESTVTKPDGSKVEQSAQQTLRETYQRVGK